MASSIIHIAVAKEINKELKRDSNKLYLGSIAPDISKLIGETKKNSHFLDNNETNIPNLDRFLKKYKDKLDDDFVMGYYIHLFTDYLWFKYFLSEFYRDGCITKLDGTVFKCTNEMAVMYIYNDYTDMNIKIIDEYELDLKLFYNEPPKLDDIIEEIPMDKISLIIDKASIIIENSKTKKDMTFNIDNVKKFISFSTEIILNDIKKL